MLCEEDKDRFTIGWREDQVDKEKVESMQVTTIDARI